MDYIIRNKTKLNDIKLLAIVNSVVNEGMLSTGKRGQQYCKRRIVRGTYLVICRKNKCSYSFTISKI